MSGRPKAEPRRGRGGAQTAAYRDRGVYAGLRGAAPLAFVERRSLSNGAMLDINIQHDF